jgi:HSP20 family molecular chaperone IbpA
LSLDARLATHPESGWNPVHLEYRIGDFHREFRISDDVDPGAVSASMRDGVLELNLPKSETHRPRTIAIQTG